MTAFRFILLALLLAAPSLAPAAQPQERAPDTMAARVMACAPCHGVDGQGTKDDYFPRIAGKPADYLYNQLSAFADGRRKYAPMNYLLEYLPDSYLHEIAQYFAGERPPYAAPVPPVASRAVLERGRTIVTQGDPAREIPACANCHGPAFTGMQPAIPALVGLPAKYVSAQLGAWRYGTRTAAEPDCMQIVAGHLTEADVTAVAAYLSSLAAPADPSPVPAGSLAMPLACGSVPVK